jgi:hypothetical protein
LSGLHRDKSRIAEGLPIPLCTPKEEPDKSISFKGAEIAQWLNGFLVAEGRISKSHGEKCLRFNCQNGHNFFLPLQHVEETHRILENAN